MAFFPALKGLIFPILSKVYTPFEAVSLELGILNSVALSLFEGGTTLSADMP
jgi:hypothetical protein